MGNKNEVKPHGYKLARGNMALVWARLICPVCDGEIENFEDEYEDDLHLDICKCDRCELFIVYISPRAIHEYHEVSPSQRWYRIEQAW
jgi:hypothetical protein